MLLSLFEYSKHRLNMYLAHGIIEETLLFHHICGVTVYALLAYGTIFLICVFFSTRLCVLTCLLTTCLLLLVDPAYVFFANVILIEEMVAPMVHFGWILTK